MSNVIESNIVLGADQNIASGKVDSVTDNSSVGSGGMNESVKKTNVAGNAIATKGDVKAPPDANEATQNTNSTNDSSSSNGTLTSNGSNANGSSVNGVANNNSYTGNVGGSPVTKKRLEEGMSKLPEKNKELIKNVSDDGVNLETMVSNQLSTFDPISNPGNHVFDITNDIISMVMGENGARPDTNCRFLKGFLGGSNLDWSIAILLNLLILAMMIICAFVNAINDFLKQIDNPYIREATKIIGLGILLKESPLSKVSNFLPADKLSASSGNVFEKKDKRPVQKRRYNNYNNNQRSNNSNSAINDLTKTELSQEQANNVKATPDEEYSSIFEPNTDVVQEKNSVGIKKTGDYGIDNSPMTIFDKNNGINEQSFNNNKSSDAPFINSPGRESLNEAIATPVSDTSKGVDIQGLIVLTGGKDQELSFKEAKNNGYTATFDEYKNDMVSDQTVSYQKATANGYQGTIEEWGNVTEQFQSAEIVSGNNIKEVYPNIEKLIVSGYRFPTKETNLEDEYSDLMLLLNRINPNLLIYNRNGNSVTNMTVFYHGSNDFLKLLTKAPNSEYRTEAMCCKSYVRNNVSKLLESQYKYLKV